MGEYTGRRRGRPAPEPAYQAPETDDYVDPYSQPNYFVDDAYYAEDLPVDDDYYPEAETAYAETQYSDSYYRESEHHGYEESEYYPDPEPQYAEPRLEPVRHRARERADVPGSLVEPSAWLL